MTDRYAVCIDSMNSSEIEIIIQCLVKIKDFSLRLEASILKQNSELQNSNNIIKEST